MEFITNHCRYTNPQEIDAGGEGVVYAVGIDTCVKIYHPELLNREPQRRDKVLALCNLFKNFAYISNTANFAAFPQLQVYQTRESIDDIVGFAMHWFKDCSKIGQLGFDLENNSFREDKGFRFDDKRALGFIYNVFEAIDQIHAARIVLGDVNPGNVLYDRIMQRPVIIDLDAAQVGNYGCPTTLDLYNDPQLEQRSRNSAGGLVFDGGTDLFALAVVCFEFWVGVRPHFLYLTPHRHQKPDVENKKLGISNIRCFALGRDYLSQFGIKYLDISENQQIEARIAQLKVQDLKLYEYFVDVFANGERENLLLSLPIQDRRHPGSRFTADKDFTEIINALAGERDKEAQRVQEQQGYIKPTIGVPDSDFMKVIDSMVFSPAKLTAKHNPKISQVRRDPIGFENFMQQFGLTI
jgi:serine/threonine protein kinase